MVRTGSAVRSRSSAPETIFRVGTNMFYVYILYSAASNRYYVGSAADLIVRLRKHNEGKVRSTKAYRPWAIIHQECFKTRSEARKRENQIKRMKSGAGFKSLIKYG